MAPYGRDSNAEVVDATLADTSHPAKYVFTMSLKRVCSNQHQTRRNESGQACKVTVRSLYPTSTGTFHRRKYE